MLLYHNLNLKDIVSPVNSAKLRELLEATAYNKQETEFLINSFEQGFELGYEGPEFVNLTSPNLKFTIGDDVILWNKVMKEVKAERYAGPFRHIPFLQYIQSPIGLVPKDQGKATRLIFHLSYPRVAKDKVPVSVNANVPKAKTSVHYPDISEAIKICILEGRGCKLGKSDMKSAFRHFGIRKADWKYLVMKAKSPLDGLWYYFVDKCMPFGGAISCSHFQRFSNAVSHIVTALTQKENINYLDDYLFIAYLKQMCNDQLECFIVVCQQINFPISEEKTVWGTTMITFLGYLLDTRRQKIFIPKEKVEAALLIIRDILGRKSKKTTLKEMQRLCGILNFFSRCIVPGKAFNRRLYAITKGLRLPHHHAKITAEAVLDLRTWETFLGHQEAFSRSFADFSHTWYAKDIDMYSDSSRNPYLGCGGVSGNEWFALQWNYNFIVDQKPSIAYLELYAVTVAVLLWCHKFKNRKIALFCDNMSAVQMINKSTSKCRNCMILIRMIVMQGMLHNVHITAKHVMGKANTLSDHLSRRRIRTFKKLTGSKFKQEPEDIPSPLWPMNKVWLH